MLCTIWKYIVLIRIALKTRIGRGACGVSSNTGFQYNTDSYNIFVASCPIRVFNIILTHTISLWRLVQYGFSIQYWLVQYLSILYITLYNNLLVLKNEMKYKKYHTVTTVTKSNCKMVERGKIDTPNTYIHDDSFFRLCTGISIKSVGFNLVLCVQTSSLSEMMRSCKWYHTFFYVPKQEMCASQNMPVYINYQMV